VFDLTCGAARATVVPAMGGGLAGLWHAEKPVLRPCADPAASGPFDLALNILAPFSNRIAGGFWFEGTQHLLTTNFAGEPCPIHGDAFQRAWQIEAATTGEATLRLDQGVFGPFRYAARLVYRLSEGGLSASLALCNTSDSTLPFGFGFHPWFPRSPATRLAFAAAGHWPEGDRHLPATLAEVALPATLDFAMPRALPEGWINTGFADWTGTADILQGWDAASVRLTAQRLATVIVYSPGRKSGFFCFEPVSHPVNAHNLPGQPGLVALAPGGDIACRMTLEWSGYAP
jgi:aldose 1-epimerase